MAGRRRRRPGGQRRAGRGEGASAGRVSRCRRCLRPRRLLTLAVILGLLLVGGRAMLLIAASGTPDASDPTAVGLGGDARRPALVLGAGLRPDGTPTRLLQDRIRASVRLLEQRQVDLLLMSGDNSVRGYSEPSAMRRAAIELGAPADRVAVDYGGRRTWDSCVRARKVFGVRRAIVVTNDFHRARTVVLCREAGIAVDGAIGTPTSAYPPRARAAWQTRELVASWLGAADAWVREPTAAVGGQSIDPWQRCDLFGSLSPSDRKDWPAPSC